MKNILIGVAALVLVGGVTYTMASRGMFTVNFSMGDKPTEQQFSDTIDSVVNLQDDAVKPGATKEHNPTKAYIAGDTVVKQQEILQAKVLTESQKEFKMDAVQTVTFRWTPVVPKPQEPVTYRLKVWQLMQGQNSAQAIEMNDPLLTKDVTDMSEATISGLYTGPCKPPYLCDFVWSVEMVSTTGTKTDSEVQGTPAGTVSSGATETGTQVSADGTH